jgi:lysophospholipase L1-like esterase
VFLKFVPFLLALFAFGLPDALLAQTVPDFSEWFLAEGAQNAFFDEEILIANPNAGPVQVQITYFPQFGTAPLPQTFTMRGTSRMTVRLRDVAGLPQSPVSARITCLEDLPIVVERGMYWLGRLAGHSAAGVTALSTKWHLAEGATGGTFDDYVLVANPSSTPATVRLTFLPATGASPVPWDAPDQVPAGGRATYRINDVPAMQSIGPFGFSTVVESLNGVAIAAERAMYWGGLRGGHDTLGVTEPSLTWHFGEGATSGNAALQFSTFFLLQNPSPTATATVTLTAFLDGVSTPVPHQVTLPPSSRRTVYANSSNPDIGFPGLPPGGIGFATTISSTVPIIAERAIYFGVPGQPWADGHATAGATSLASAWAFADGVEGPSAGDPAGLAYTTFFLISNPNAAALPIKVTFLREDGTGIVVDETVPPQSRFNVLPFKYPELIGQRFATFIRATDTSQKFVAERSVYWRGASGGHANLGIPWENLPIAPPPPPPTPRVTSVSPAQGRLSGGTTVTITGENFTPGTTVSIGGVAATNVTFVSPQRITAVAPAAPGKRAGQVELKVTNAAGFAIGTFTYMLRVLAFGDSITRGTTSTSVCGVDGCVIVPGVVETPYPMRLRELLGGDAQFAASQDVTNAGEPGECASAANCAGNAGESRLPGVLDQTYDVVVLLEGANDIGRPGLATSQQAHQARDGLSSMVTTTQARGRRIIISRMTPLQDASDTDEPRKDPLVYQELDGLIEQLASARGLPRILWGTVSMSPDGLHPTQSGYHAMASQVLQKIREVYRP